MCALCQFTGGDKSVLHIDIGRDGRVSCARLEGADWWEGGDEVEVPTFTRKKVKVKRGEKSKNRESLFILCSANGLVDSSSFHHEWQFLYTCHQSKRAHGPGLNCGGG